MTLAYGQDNWQWLNPQPTGYGCVKVIFTDHRKGFILNDGEDRDAVTELQRVVV